MPSILALLLLLAAVSYAAAGDITVEDRPLAAPVAPVNPSGPAPMLRDCKVTTARAKDAAGTEVETTHRICHWAIPPS